MYHTIKFEYCASKNIEVEDDEIKVIVETARPAKLMLDGKEASVGIQISFGEFYINAYAPENCEPKDYWMRELNKGEGFRRRRDAEEYIRELFRNQTIEVIAA